MKFSFLAKHRGTWPAGWLCGALGVSRGGFAFAKCAEIGPLPMVRRQKCDSLVGLRAIVTEIRYHDDLSDPLAALSENSHSVPVG